MEKHLRKSQTLYSLSAFLFFFLCIVISLLGWYLQSLYFYLAIIVFSFLGLITHTVYINHLKKSLLTLIEMCETIIDQSNQNIPNRVHRLPQGLAGRGHPAFPDGLQHGPGQRGVPAGADDDAPGWTGLPPLRLRRWDRRLRLLYGLPVHEHVLWELSHAKPY